MGTRTIVKKVVEGLFESNPNASGSDFEAKRAVASRFATAAGVSINTTATNVIVDYLSNLQVSDNSVVEGFEITPNVAINANTTNYVVVTLSKLDANGANKTTVAQINTATITNVNAFQSIQANMATHSANTEVVVGGTLVYDVAITAAGVSANSCRLAVTKRLK